MGENDFRSKRKTGVEKEDVVRLQGLRDEFKDILDTCGIVIMVYIQEGNIEEIYGDIESVCGLSKDELLKNPSSLNERIIGKNADDIREKRNRFISDATDELLIQDFSLDSRTGTAKWVREKMTLSESDSIPKIICTVKDISDEKLKEKELSEFEAKVSELNASKDRFINMLSHDLRTPFTSILGFAEILMKEPDMPLEERMECVGYIYEASSTQLQLVNNLLDWSRLRMGRISIETQHILVDAAVYNALSSLSYLAEKKNVSIESEIEDTLYVQAAQSYLLKIITAIVSNAIKYSYPGQKIMVGAKRKTDYISFWIKDFGIGMNREKKENLFNPDTLFTTDGTQGEKGSGFTLMLIGEVIKVMKGTIEVESHESEGTVVHFSLPAPSNLIYVAIPDEFLKEKIINIIKENFSHLEVRTFSGGVKISKTDTQKFPGAFIATHIQETGKTALSVAKSLKEHYRLSELPGLILGDNLTPDIEAEYLSIGIKTILSMKHKPSDITAVLKRVLL